MSKSDSFLINRFKEKEKKEKVGDLIERSSGNPRPHFSSPFEVAPLSDAEKEGLQALLETYQTEEVRPLEDDLQSLLTLTSEIKAIDNQAVILHGERIKKAHTLLKKYREGAFTHWLIKTYGNRQTPYNFLQYYDFYTALPKPIREITNAMPRQVIYHLSSRPIPWEKKVAFVKAYRGESKTLLLDKLRSSFPLPKQDKRSGNQAKNALHLLQRAKVAMGRPTFSPSKGEKRALQALIRELQALIP